MNYVAVLTAASGVPDAVADMVRNEVQGTVNRLSPTAVEVAFVADTKPVLPSPERIDLNILPAEGRRKSILIADMDSTIITVECIDELADYAGKKAEVSDITERAMRGELDFEAALRARVAMLKGVTRDDISACYTERVRLNAGARQLVQTMNGTGARTALVSGGFTVFTDKVVAATGFGLSRANTLLFDGDALSGAVGDPICHAGTKYDVMMQLVAETGGSTADVIAVGDGANDVPMVAAAGIGVAYKAKPALREAASAVLDYSDLTALLALQGIAPDAAGRAS